MSSVNVADVNLPLANVMKVLGVTIDQHLTFEKHISVVARSCNYHIQAIRHVEGRCVIEISVGESYKIL